MTPRSIRRAAERKAQKEMSRAMRQGLGALASERTTVPVASSVASLAAPEPPSERRLAANRANAQLSTGPTSAEGKAKVSLNAVKTGLTGQTVLLPSDDVAAYEALVAAFTEQYQPATAQERQLVQNLADTRWRLNRIPTLEFALFARGHHEFAEKFATVEPSLASAMIDAETIVVYGKQLKNLHTQEGRLRRHYQQDLAELTALQAERNATETAAAAEAEVKETKRTPLNGFEFTNDECRPSDALKACPLPQLPIRTRAA